MEKLCGTCSQHQGLSLYERISLAESIELNTMYICPSCSIYFGVYGNKWIKNESLIDFQEDISKIPVRILGLKTEQISLF